MYFHVVEIRSYDHHSGISFPQNNSSLLSRLPSERVEINLHFITLILLQHSLWETRVETTEPVYVD